MGFWRVQFKLEIPDRTQNDLESDLGRREVEDRPKDWVKVPVDIIGPDFYWMLDVRFRSEAEADAYIDDTLARLKPNEKGTVTKHFCTHTDARPNICVEEIKRVR